MNKFLLVVLSLLFLSEITDAQDFEYGYFTQEEVNMKSYKNDTSAHAVVLNEYGNAYISTQDHLPLIFEYHVKIKIFDSKGFKEGNIEIPIRVFGDEIESVDDISGITYYKDENGFIQKTPFDSKDIFITKDNKYRNTVKFAMPNLREGCIIEYKYRLTSPYDNEFCTWMFQSNIPKISSYYKAQIPGVYSYNIVLRGALRLLEGKEYAPQLERECFSYYGIKCDCSILRFAMKDIPAFIVEEDMTSPKNFMSGIYFEMSERYNMQTGSTKKITKEWKDVDHELKGAYYFGDQIKKKDIFKEKLTPLLAGKTDTLERAKIAFRYVQNNIKWNDFISRGSWDGIRKAFDKRTGNVADINLGLVAALNFAGVNADAVLLSTRDNGIVSKLSPVVEEFNYIIVKTDIGGKTYLLDATDPLLSFGLLPLRCLNDQGRVISLNKPSYWIDINKQSQSSTSALNFTLTENGKLKGTIVNYWLGYEAYTKRKAIKAFSSKEEYFEDFDEKWPRLKVISASVSNLDTLDQPLTETYEVEIDSYDNLDARMTFNPFLFNRITVNPYKLVERSYPVDRGMASSKRVSLTIKLPEKYTVENPPKNINIALPDNGGQFVTNFDASKNVFTFSHAIVFKKPIYTPQEYLYLKELYNQIILSEKVDLVFKKN